MFEVIMIIYLTMVIWMLIVLFRANKVHKIISNLIDVTFEYNSSVKYHTHLIKMGSGYPTNIVRKRHAIFSNKVVVWGGSDYFGAIRDRMMKRVNPYNELPFFMHPKRHKKRLWKNPRKYAFRAHRKMTPTMRREVAQYFTSLDYYFDHDMPPHLKKWLG